MTISDLLVHLLPYLIAVAIPAFAIYLIYSLDFYGTSKFTTVLVCALWGAVGAAAIGWLVNNEIEHLFTYELVVGLAAPIVEETAKALILWYFIRQPGFKYFVDGAIYGFAIGIGFSVSETVLVYLPANPQDGLALAVSRVLSSSLMHATTTALVGLLLGRARRSKTPGLHKWGWVIAGIVPAMMFHSGFNLLNLWLKDKDQPFLLLLLAIAIGVIGSAAIAFLINLYLEAERKDFKETLGMDVGITGQERQAVQRLGKMDEILQKLGGYFGEDKIEKISRLLVIQANIGILQNNLRSASSDRLRKAWQEEVANFRAEIDAIRNELGAFVMSYLRGVFPADDAEMVDAFSHAVEESDPTQIHAFDIFMLTSQRAGTVAVDELTRRAEILQRVEILKEVDLADLENLSRAITTQTFSDGTVIFKEGDDGDTMYIIEQGGINIYSKNSATPENLLRSSGVGEVVGELALLDGDHRSAQAVAVGNCKTIILRREQFMMFLRSRPRVILAILQFLTRRVRYTTEIIETSVTWATNITHGNYKEAQAIKGPPSPVGRGNYESVVQTAGPLTAHVGASVTAETPKVLQGVFSKVSSVLESREQAIRAKVLETDAVPDITELSEVPHKVMSLLLNHPIAEGYTIEALQDKLRDISDVRPMLADLEKEGWLIVSGEATHRRYRANLHRKKAKGFDPFRAMAAKVEKKPGQN